MMSNRIFADNKLSSESEIGPLILTRQVELQKFDVLMEIGRQERREELHAVLLLADQLGGRVTPLDIIRELLLGRPESIGKAIIDRCQYLDLLDYRGTLTEIGREALRTSSVFVPERGRYTLWYTDDSLIPQKLLHLESVNESWLKDEVTSFRNNEPKDDSKEATETICNELKRLERYTYKLMGKGGGEVLIQKIEDYGIISKLNQTDNLRLKLLISQRDAPHLSVSGKFSYTLEPPQLDFTNSWLSALGSEAESWEKLRNPPALKTSFLGLNEKELTSFKKTVTLHQPRISPYGEFETTQVEGVPIIPKSENDASQWVKWLLKRSVDTYLTEERYNNLANTCRQQFPDYKYLDLPTRMDLSLDFMKERDPAGRMPRQFWYLQAPIDLLPSKDNAGNNIQERSVW